MKRKKTQSRPVEGEPRGKREQPTASDRRNARDNSPEAPRGKREVPSATERRRPRG